MNRKFRLLRDDIGCCICEDCKEYSTVSKICRLGKKCADEPDSCTEFKCAYGVIGDARMTEEYENDV